MFVCCFGFVVRCPSLCVVCWFYVFDLCCSRLSLVGVGLCYVLFVVRLGLWFLVVCCCFCHGALRECCLKV